MENKKPGSVTVYGLIITSLLTIASWGVLNYFENERNKDNKIREIKINYLIDAYRKLANGVQRSPSIAAYHRDLESAVADIQLFGSKEDIDILIDELNKAKDTANHVLLNVDVILNKLRNSLRKEIKLEEVDSNVQWFRFSESPNLDSSLKLLK